MDAPTTAAPIEAVLEGEARIKLGDASTTAIRHEQINALAEAKESVDVEYDALGPLTAVEARAQLEAIGFALDEMRRAVDALWYLAPDDGSPIEERP